MDTRRKTLPMQNKHQEGFLWQEGTDIYIGKSEKEIMELKKEEKGSREICGFEIMQLKNFINQYNRKQDKIKTVFPSE